jgi:2-methylcitrate dehydratase PrpD
VSKPLTGLSSRVAEAAARIDLSTRPEDLAWDAKAHLLDCLGMMVAGMTAERVRKFRRLDPEAGLTPTTSDLAFELSLLCGARGLDDFDESTRAHPGAVIVPALLAGQDRQSARRSGHPVSGAEFLAGLIAGYQLMGGLGEAMGAPHLHSRGYHPSTILGAPSAALAVGRMLAFPEATLAHSVGIGASLACGTTQFDAEEEVRGLQTAWAASSGLAAVRLASLGYQSSDTALEARNGLIGRTAPDFDASHGDLMSYLPPRIQSVSYKPYPHFSDLHPATSALFEILSGQRIDLRDVERVTVRVSERVAERLHAAYPPVNSREAKRSPGFVMAVVLTAAAQGGSAGSLVGAFAESSLADEEILELGRRVSLRSDIPVSTSGPQAVVDLQLRDGSHLSREATGYPGDGRSSNLRWGWAEVLLRFQEMVQPVLGTSRIGWITEFVAGMDQSPDVSHELDQIIGLLLPSRLADKHG